MPEETLTGASSDASTTAESQPTNNDADADAGKIEESLPAADADDDDAGDAYEWIPDDVRGGKSAQNGGVSDSDRVLKAIPQQMIRDAGGPNISTPSNVTGLSEDETRAALGELLVDGKVEKQGDEYHTAAVADGGDSDE